MTSEKIGNERLKAFVNRDHAKYSTGVHPSIKEVELMARELQQARVKLA